MTLEGIKESALMAVDTVWANKLRSALTILGVCVGVLTIIFMVSIIQVKPGMSKEKVRQMVGEPESVVTAEDGEHWTWSAGNHRGFLFRTLRLASQSGHYELVVTFNEQNRTSDVLAGSS